MTPDESLALPPADARAKATVDADRDQDSAAGLWPWIEQRLEQASEWLNPILVKEARQALKSLQFAIAFGAVLAFAYGWSLVGLATTENSLAAVARQGPQMLMGYCVILAFPLLVIIPFTAFRSLAVEREDGTYDLLCVTTLGPEQIVFGKLTSAMVQMVVYLSAVAPCIAFTYLLPGANIVVIGMILTYLIVACVFFSTLGLLLATGTKAKHWQVVLSIAVVLGLFGAFVGACNIIGELTFRGGGMPVELVEFWVAHSAILAGLFSFSLLFILAAAAQISFDADNHSTRLRSVMIGQTALVAGYTVYFCLLNADGFYWHMHLVVGLTLAGIGWAVVGSMMMGESGELSPRARRELPQSLLGRILFTWLNPGSGTGYFFVLANMAVLAILGQILVADSRVRLMATTPYGGRPPMAIDLYGWMLLGYLACYLGIGRLLMLLFGWAIRGTDAGAAIDSRGGPVLALVLHIVLLLLGVFVPLTVQLTFFRDDQYSLLQVSNPFWTLSRFVDPYQGATLLDGTGYVIGCVGCGIALVNLLFTLHDVEVAREEAPERVREDERALEPAPAVRKGPFDDREFKTPALPGD